MKINVEKVKELIEDKFRGNLSFFAETIGIDRSYLHQIFNKQKNENSPKTCNAIIKYCEKNNLKYEDYIFLD